jgi:2-keto-4-pentenoate hydratase/2-oxohepta-3-ene-1,7-dioic acid hydratase in catechol pathway
MKFLAFERKGMRRLGVRHGEHIVDLQMLDPRWSDPEVLYGGSDALDAVKSSLAHSPKQAYVQPEEVRPLWPIAQPRKIMCLGLNYDSHVAESIAKQRPSHPMLFLRAVTSLAHPEQPLLRPRCSEQLDFEGELVAVIGRRVRGATMTDALSCVAGYSIFNDGSVRNYQRLTTQWTLGKNFDQTGGFGPQLVTADELPPGAAGLKLTTRLNGVVVQSANTAEMLFGVAETIALLSEVMTLEPGDLLVMGTPAGVGAAREPPLWMKPGDVCEVEIEGIGVLRNPIADAPD